MTNTQRLVALLGFQPSADALEATLLDNDLYGLDEYVAANLKKIKLAAIPILQVLLSTADTANATTGFSTKYDRPSLQKLLDQLLTDTGKASSSIIKAVRWC